VAARRCLPPGANVSVAAPTRIPYFRPSKCRPLHSATRVKLVSSRRSVESLSGLATVLLFHFSAAVLTNLTNTFCHANRQFARSGQISEFHIFAPSISRPCTVQSGMHAPPTSRRHWHSQTNSKPRQRDLVWPKYYSRRKIAGRNPFVYSRAWSLHIAVSGSSAFCAMDLNVRRMFCVRQRCGQLTIGRAKC